MAATQAGFESTLKPTIAKPTSSSTHDLKGVGKKRLRIGGRKKTKEEYKADIIKLLAKPMTSGQIAEALGRDSVDSLRRDYLMPLVEAGQLEKQGDYYKRAGVTEKAVDRERYDDIMKKSGFAQLDTLSSLVKHCRNLDGGSKWVHKYWKICTGRQVPGFKCRPEHWTAETTLQFIAAYQQHKGEERLPGEIRQMLRYIHEYVLHKPVTDEEKNTWGIDGTKDNAGIYNHIKLSPQQIKQLIDFFIAKGDLECAGYGSFGIETFGRSEAIFKSAIGTMVLTPRTLHYATVAGDPEPNFDPVAVRQMRIVAAMNPSIAQIHTVNDEIFEGTLKEFKTNHAPWPKYIVDSHCVATFKEYLTTRKGKATYFGKDGENFNQFNTRMSAAFKAAYKEMGLILSDKPQKHTAEWYYWRRPTYVLRHIGAHVWLGRLGGSYEALSEMGWEDPGVPKKFYAGYHADTLRSKIARKF